MSHPGRLHGNTHKALRTVLQSPLEPPRNESTVASETAGNTQNQQAIRVLLYAALALLALLACAMVANATFVTVGDGGTILTSSNGNSWTPQTSGVSANLHGVTCDGAHCIAVGDHGTIIASTNSGTNWSKICPNPPGTGTGCPPNNAQLTGVDTDGTTWGISGRYQLMYTSPTGTAWTAQTALAPAPPNSDDGWVAIATAPSGWILAGAVPDYVDTSTNGGSTWAAGFADHGPPFKPRLNGAATDGTTWMLVGLNYFYTSTGPPTWTWTSHFQSNSNTADFYDATYGAGKWVIAGMDNVLVSSGPPTWAVTTQPTPTSMTSSFNSVIPDGCFCVHYDGCMWILAGGTKIYRSPDATNWVDVSPGTTAGFRGLATTTTTNTCPAPTCANTTILAGNTATLVANGGFAPYMWNSPGSNAPTTGTGNTYSPTYATAGTYTVTVTGQGANVPSSTCTVTVIPLLACSPTAQYSVLGTATSLTATGGTPAYTWTTTGSNSNGPTTGTTWSGTFSALGSHTINMHDAATGVLAQSTSCTAETVPVLTCSPASQTFLTGGTATMTAAGGTPTYAWTTPGSTNTPATGTSWSGTYNTAGTYTATLTDQGIGGGAQTVTCSVQVNNPPMPTCSPTTQLIEITETATMDAGAGTGSFTWTTPAGATPNLTGTTMQATFPATGTYPFTVTDTALPHQTATCTVTVVNPPPPTCSTPQRPYPGVEARLSGHLGLGQYTWNTTGGSKTTGTGPTFRTSYLNPGTYVVTIHDSATPTQTGTCTVTVQTPPPPPPRPGLPYPQTPRPAPPQPMAQPPVATPNAKTTCGNLAVQFDGYASSDTDGLVVDWQWDFGDSTTGSGPNVQHEYATTGSYTATLTVRDDGGLTDTRETHVTVNGCQPLAIQIAPSNTQAGKELAICAKATGGDGEYTYEADLGAGLLPDATFDQRTGCLHWTPQEGAAGTDCLRITAKDAHGTATTCLNVSVTATPKPNAPKPQPLAPPATVAPVGDAKSLELRAAPQGGIAPTAAAAESPPWGWIAIILVPIAIAGAFYALGKRKAKPETLAGEATPQWPALPN